jgi:hypothetical protein
MTSLCSLFFVFLDAVTTNAAASSAAGRDIAVAGVQIVLTKANAQVCAWSTVYDSFLLSFVRSFSFSLFVTD